MIYLEHWVFIAINGRLKVKIIAQKWTDDLSIPGNQKLSMHKN